MEVDNNLIKELLQFTTAIVGNLTEEQEERLRQSFNTVLGSYFISNKKTNVVVMGESVDVRFIKEHLSHKFNKKDINIIDIPDTIGMVGKSIVDLGLSFPIILEDKIELRNSIDDVLVQAPTPTVGMIDKDSGYHSEQSSFPLKVEGGATVNDMMDSIHTIKLINPRIETTYDSGVVLSHKPHQHPYKKRNKFKPSKISHKRRK